LLNCGVPTGLSSRDWLTEVRSGGVATKRYWWCRRYDSSAEGSKTTIIQWAKTLETKVFRALVALRDRRF
jgi:hypothetical protein